MEQNFLSKENTTTIYKIIVKNFKLNNIDKSKKRDLIQELINVMKINFKLLDLNKINTNNLDSI